MSFTLYHSISMHHSALTRVTADLCDQQGIAFIPMAAELLGGWHKVALEEAEAEEAGICASRTHWPGERKDHQPPSHQGVSAPSKRALVPPSQQDPWPPLTCHRRPTMMTKTNDEPTIDQR